MDIKARITDWVEKKIGRIIDEDLKVRIVHERSQFNLQAYVNSLLDVYFTKDEIVNFKNTLNSAFQAVVNDLDSYDSDDEENNSKDSLDFDNHEFQTFSVDEIVKNLESDSEDIRIQSLQALELYAEELINHPSWIVIEKSLLKILQRADTKMHNVVLKVFFKFLISSYKPQIICEGFLTVSKALAFLINLKDDNIAYEEVYDLGHRWLHKSVLEDTGDDHFQKSEKSVDTDVLVKLMWLLIYCQQQMPEKWVRFNEKRLREIIFSFVHLLSSTQSKENKNITALHLLSILNPTASWCRSWCRTAVGRNLLSSALRKYKNFFIRMVEIILNKIKTKRVKQLKSVRSNEVISKNHSKKGNEISSDFIEKNTAGEENHLKQRAKHVRSAPVNSMESDNYSIFWRIKKNSKWLTEGIPKKVVNEAIFWHSVSVVVCLIQFRCGQALFPIQTATRKRSLSVQDLSLSLTEYFQNLECNKSSDEEFGFTVAYRAEVLKKIEVLKNVRNNALSSRRKIEGSPISHT